MFHYSYPFNFMNFIKEDNSFYEFGIDINSDNNGLIRTINEAQNDIYESEQNFVDTNIVTNNCLHTEIYECLQCFNQSLLICRKNDDEHHKIITGWCNKCDYKLHFMHDE